DVADAEAACGARETPVGDQGDLVAHALAVERRRGGEHLAHAGAAARAFVADDDDLAFLVLTLGHGLEGVFLALEPAGRALADLVLHAGDLPDRALWCAIAFQTDGPAGLGDGFGHRIDDVLVLVELHAFQILR